MEHHDVHGKQPKTTGLDPSSGHAAATHPGTHTNHTAIEGSCLTGVHPAIGNGEAGSEGDRSKTSGTVLPTLHPAWGGVPVFSDRTIMPVHVKMIHEAVACSNGGPIVINRTAVSTLRLFGLILEAHETQDKGFFKLYDGTGIIKASIWILNGGGELTDFRFAKDFGGYAMVVGRVKVDEGEAVIDAFSCRTSGTTQTVLEKPVEPPPSPASAEDMAEAAELTTRILQLVRAHSSPESRTLAGLSLADICVRVAAPEAAVRESLAELGDSGEVYTTIDEEHFKAT
ncbi:hypothetical protein ACP4OV_005437 [Aristida adscensionis]